MPTQSCHRRFRKENTNNKLELGQWRTRHISFLLSYQEHRSQTNLISLSLLPPASVNINPSLALRWWLQYRIYVDIDSNLTVPTKTLRYLEELCNINIVVLVGVTSLLPYWSWCRHLTRWGGPGWAELGEVLLNWEQIKGSEYQYHLAVLSRPGQASQLSGICLIT